MLKKSFPAEYDGLLLTPCNSVHTLFMRFAIDVVFLNGEQKVVHMVSNMFPGKVSPVIKGARYVLELPANNIKQHGLLVGDQITWDESGKVVRQ
jgi:uncharacterized membrane protein (UPF0127 family)